jgi:predicted DNA-binding transcriptional regulator AlpA
MTEVPFEYRIWTAKQCAEYLGYTLSYFRNQVRYQDGFPEQLSCGLRWKATEVVEWALRREKETA